MLFCWHWHLKSNEKQHERLFTIYSWKNGGEICLFCIFLLENELEFFNCYGCTLVLLVLHTFINILLTQSVVNHMSSSFSSIARCDRLCKRICWNVFRHIFINLSAMSAKFEGSSCSHVRFYIYRMFLHSDSCHVFTKVSTLITGTRCINVIFKISYDLWPSSDVNWV